MPDTALLKPRTVSISDKFEGLTLPDINISLTEKELDMGRINKEISQPVTVVYKRTNNEDALF